MTNNKKANQHDHNQMHHEKMDHEHMNHEMHHEHMHHDHMNHDHMDHAQMNHDMHGGHDHSMHMGNFKQKFWISLLLALPILILSPLMGLSFSWQEKIQFPGYQWLILILATVLLVYGGKPFYQGAKQELQQKSPGMMTLIAMGISVAYGYSLYAFIANQFLQTAHVMDFFWELASLIVIMLLGHWIEMDTVMAASNALEKMAALLPEDAKVIDDQEQIKNIPLNQVTVGQHLLVSAGEKIPTDAVVIKGNSFVNESLITGEAKPIEKKVQDTVIGGSVNGNGSLTIQVTATGQSGYLAQVMQLVGQAQKEKSKVETLADTVAKYLFYAALVVGIAAFISWLFLADMNTAFARMVAVFVIACPHALGLAIPLVVARSTSLAAANGLLMRNRQALEVAPKVTTILMDKTGTLTQGVFKVNQLKSLSPQYTDEKISALIAGLEQHSNHPLALSLIEYTSAKGVKAVTFDEVQTLAGVGMTGQVAKQQYDLVNAKYLTQHQITFDQTLFNELANQGNSISYLVTEQTVIGILAQGDTLKTDAADFIKTLQQNNIQPVMLTGDNELAAKQVAHQLGGIAYQANLMPEDKAKIVKDYQNQGQHVMMVGDGINDAPSLAQADLGVAIGAGTDVAIESADVILVKSQVTDILQLLNLAKATRRKMIENLWWGAGYNVIAMPLAAGVLAGVGIILSPAVGALIMSFSTVIVATNAMLLKIK